MLLSQLESFLYESKTAFIKALCQLTVSCLTMAYTLLLSALPAK